jgi:hypothetical protein
MRAESLCLTRSRLKTKGQQSYSATVSESLRCSVLKDQLLEHGYQVLNLIQVKMLLLQPPAASVACPILVVKHHIVRRYMLPIIVSIPLVDSMSPVFQLQDRMTITSLPECRVVWLWITEP